MKFKTVLTTVFLVIVMTVSVYAQSKELPVEKMDIAYLFVNGTIDRVQNRVGELTLVDSYKDSYFPVAFDVYEGQGLRITTVKDKKEIFSIKTTVEDYSTTDGLIVGDDAEKVKNLYGAYEFYSSRNKNNERVMVWSNMVRMTAMRIVIDIDTNKVKSIGIGRILD